MPETATDWQTRLDLAFAEKVAKLSDRDLRTALDGVHYESPDYEILIRECEKRHIDI